MDKINFLDCPVHAAKMQETVDFIENSIKQETHIQHVVVNVAKLVNMRRDSELAASVQACDIINIDGMGVVWGARLCGHRIPERVAGIDLFHQLLLMSSRQGFPVYFLGAKDEVVKKAADVLKQQYPDLKIAGYHHGYFWDDEAAMVKKIKDSGAKLLFVAITSPKKENFINRWQQELSVNFVMGVGGTFDVVAGKVKRAPVWMQKIGCEWLFRVIQEPRRMWKRYLRTNTIYLFLLLRHRFQKKQSPL